MITTVFLALIHACLGELSELVRYGMDCSAEEYYHNGQCHRCPQCPPGQELKEDCGHGAGVSAVCGVCDPRWFKEDWGSQPCALCQNCRRLNRYQIKRCTHTDNAVCGNCLPGFYSKMRLDGLEDLECLPCGPSPFRNVQCSRGEVIGVAEVQTSEAPVQNTSTIVTACAATAVLTTFLFAIVCIMYQTRSSLRKTCKRCLSPVGSRQCDTETASIPMTAVHTVMQKADVDRSGPRLPLEGHCTLDDIIETVTSDLRLHEQETGTDLAAGLILQATESPYLSSSDSDLSSQHLIFTLVGGQSTPGPYCAVEQQTGWGLHAPVECTELDLQHLSSTLQFQAHRPSGIIPTNSPLHPDWDSTLPLVHMLQDPEQKKE